MVLTKEQRIELLARARQAKQEKTAKAKDTLPPQPEVVVKVELPPAEPPTPKPKKTKKVSQPVPIPVPVQVIQESESEEEEVIEVPIPVPKKKALPKKWLKAQAEPVKVCCNEPLTKEEPLITDEKPLKKALIEKNIIIPDEKEMKKARKPRASATAPRTLELTPIEDVFEDIQNNDVKYRPKVKLPPVAPPQMTIKKRTYTNSV